VNAFPAFTFKTNSITRGFYVSEDDLSQRKNRDQLDPVLRRSYGCWGRRGCCYRHILQAIRDGYVIYVVEDCCGDVSHSPQPLTNSEQGGQASSLPSLTRFERQPVSNRGRRFLCLLIR